MKYRDWTNSLFYGDNLKILRNFIQDDCIDLIYLDPPFKPALSYNLLCTEATGEFSEAQRSAHAQSWRWSVEAEREFHVAVTGGPSSLAELLQLLRRCLGCSRLMAYLTMMAPRLVELRRVLKPTGSLYLHCAPDTSHYLKLLLDAVFGTRNFRNELIWKRTSAHSSARRFGAVHDTLLFYSKTDRYHWHPVYRDGNGAGRAARPARRFHCSDLTGAGVVRDGATGRPWRGIDVSRKGRHWMHPPAELDDLDRRGLIHWPEKPGGMPRRKRAAEDAAGILLQDVWTDVPPVSARSEKLPFRTQKPEALLDRVIRASSQEGDLVLDPFCGSGTTMVAAERLSRRWLGIDVTHLAVSLAERRLAAAFAGALRPYDVRGDPSDVAGAQALARRSRHQFEFWALGLLGAQPGNAGRKGADSGIDGIIRFFDDRSARAKRILVQVKSGQVHRSDVHELKGVLQREQAAIAVLLTLQPPTRRMLEEAASAGFYEPEHYPRHHFPRLQILTVAELLDGKPLKYPRIAPGAQILATGGPVRVPARRPLAP